jgi:Cu-Zn family superoxide dismutase
MPNVTVAANGVLQETVTLPHATMAQLLDADGSSIMIHANADDYVSQPAGNSGPKIACAVIQPGAEVR